MKKFFIILFSVSLIFFSCSQPGIEGRIVEITKPPIVPETFSIRIDDSQKGSIYVVPEAEKYLKDITVKIEAQANEGYKFTGFTGTITSTQNPTLITVAKNEWIIPTFEKIDSPPPEITYTVRIDTSRGGGISVNPMKDLYSPGDLVFITAEPSQGFQFAGWQGTRSPTTKSFMLSVEGNEWIIPMFTPITPEPQPIEYTVRVDSVKGGSVTYDPIMPNNTYLINSFVKITAVPMEEYVFAGWVGTVTSTQNPLIMKVTANTWLVPQFTKKNTYQIITNLNPLGGSISVAPNTLGGYTYGDKCTLTAIANPNYQFDGWIGDITSSQQSLHLTITGDIQIEACFSIIPSDTTYTCTITQPDPITGILDWIPKKTRYSENEIIRVTAIPANGYMFNKWNDNSTEPIIRDYMVTSDMAISATFKMREWTHIVYMAGDNNLDIHALNDLNELEAAHLNNSSMSILALIDRKSGNGSWSDTRLYEIMTDPLGNSGTIVSKRLDCVNLDILANVETELDMSNPSTLKNLLSFTQESYKAENYSLIMWGHGSGWRGLDSRFFSYPAESRAVAIEEFNSNMTYMGIRDFAHAIKDSTIELETIAFDTCFGAEMEVVYELIGTANYFIGSAGVVDVNGWNYTDVFTKFCTTPLSSTDFNISVINSFKEQFNSSSGNPTLSIVKLSEVYNLQNAFNTWAGLISSKITTLPLAVELRTTIRDLPRSYYYGNCSSDYYADIYTLVNEVSSISHYSDVTPNEIYTFLNSTVINSWSRTIPNEQNALGIYVIGVNASKIFNTTTSPGYTNGSGQEANSFVTATPHWAATTSSIEVKSLIDKIFFTVMF